MKKIIYLVLATVILSFASCSSNTSSPSEAAKTYFGYLQQADFDKFIDGFYFGEEMSDEMFNFSKELIRQSFQQVGDSDAKDELAKLKIEVLDETLSEDGKKAKVTLRVTDSEDNSEENQVDMINIDGTWMIFAEM